MELGFFILEKMNFSEAENHWLYGDTEGGASICCQGGQFNNGCAGVASLGRPGNNLVPRVCFTDLSSHHPPPKNRVNTGKLLKAGKHNPTAQHRIF